MSVTKRTRLEVLRRDNSTCQYCGAKAADGPLTIDHVVPVSLGGSDDPSNLVAACRDCNAGKASINPDSPLVAQVSDHAAAYALGLTDRTTRIRATLQEQLLERDYFRDVWHVWSCGGKPVPLPPTWKQSVDRWRRMGVPHELYVEAIEIAMNKRGLYGEFAEFAYTAGVIWNHINSGDIDYTLTDETVPVWTDLEHRNRIHRARTEGFTRGVEYARTLNARDQHPADVALLALIDGQEALNVA